MDFEEWNSDQENMPMPKKRGCNRGFWDTNCRICSSYDFYNSNRGRQQHETPIPVK